MEKLIIDKTKELTENGKLDEIITKQATDFITGVVKDALYSYSGPSKLFKEKLEKSLYDEYQKLDLVQYSKVLSDLIQIELNKTVLEIGIEPVRKMLKDFTGELDKKTWKLSEIIEKFKDEEIINDAEYGDSGNIAFVYEKSDYGTYYIGFDEDKKGKNHRYLCKYRLMIDSKDGKMYSPTIDGINIHPLNHALIGGFDLFLFKLYAMQCCIIVDADDVETYWTTDND